MRSRNFLCLLLVTLILRVGRFVAADADPAFNPGSDIGHLSQFQVRAPILDPRPRLSSSQQAQILSDVQQHQVRFHQQRTQSNPRVTTFPAYDHVTSKYPQQSTTTPFSSLAKYKVDRTKQQQLQQLQQQQQQIQQLLQQQQQKLSQQLNQNYLNTAQLQYQLPLGGVKQQEPQLNQQFSNQYSNLATAYPDLPIFSDQQTLQTYLEKQRELQLLQKQREQLLLEQQELKKQQELLRIQQLRQLTSTTPAAIISSTPIPYIVNTTPASILLSSPTARKITPSEADLFLKAIASHQKKYSTTTPPNTPTESNKVSSSDNNVKDQEPRIQKPKSKPQIKVIYQNSANIRPDSSRTSNARSNQDITNDSNSILSFIQNSESSQGKTDKSSTSSKNRSFGSSIDKDLLLKELKFALAESSEEDDDKNITTRDLILPNGKKLQVIHAPNGLSSIVPGISPTQAGVSTTTTTIKPPKVIFEELTKGVLPPGAEFEVIRQKSDGKLEEVGKMPIQNLPVKKVTFVVLEEQPDGSYKVQGVKGNTDKESGGDVESIVERIKKGELKLPPPSTATSTTPTTPRDEGSEIDPNFISSGQSSLVSSKIADAPTTFRPTTTRSTSSITSRFRDNKSTSSYNPYITVSPNSVSTTDKYATSASSVSNHVYNTVDISSRLPSTTRTKNHFVPTMSPVRDIVGTTTSYSSLTTSTATPKTTSYVHFTSRPSTTTRLPSSTTPRSFPSTFRNDNQLFQETTLPPTEVYTSDDLVASESLVNLLRKEGLYAMAKYLRQSGLDNVLNETGPYTIFVPTDKAFRTLLVQLGGPEKAEQKFRENPRLLSGLLLHHVIPGAFRIETLQDEMTGVSLAGTQLRVNEYAMHDHEWNDIKVTTINGARVGPNKRDIEIPQGITHAIDRVMFPLPVGDLVQTLQADREKRFTTFLRLLHGSGLQETLTGPKTFTVFAPTDAAFANASQKNGAPIWTEDDGPEAAKAIVSRHIIPSTMYTAGMRYYIQKDSLRPQSPIHIHKNGGKVRVNEAHIVTQNVPATNGVLHAIDGVL